MLFCRGLWSLLVLYKFHFLVDYIQQTGNIFTFRERFDLKTISEVA